MIYAISRTEPLAHGGCECPPDCSISSFESVLSHQKKDQHPKVLVFFLVGEDGFEPSKRNAADLQSVPFGHSGTPPYLIFLFSDWSR